MSLLPQRKKTAEEIAELRGNLGIPGQQPVDESLAFADAAPLPKLDADAFEFKKDEKPVDDFSFVPTLAIEKESTVEAVSSPQNEPVVAKLVTQEPKLNTIAADLPASGEAAGKIPNRKHSLGEIDRLRRQVAFAQVEQVYDPRLQKAHPFLVALGYIPVILGALTAWFYDQPIIVTAPFVAFSLLVALYMLIRKPISRHHAGFIFAICFLAIAFGILHYFPQLQHAA